MEKEQLIAKLNWFYSLELNQVDWYTAQSKTFDGTYIGQAFARIAYMEQQHVDNIAGKIKEIGGQPTKIGDVISPILGSVAGKLISFTGLENTLKADILLEQKAMKDYKDLIAALKAENNSDEELLKILKNNHIEEDLHTAWFAGKLRNLQPEKEL
ncbi:MAG: ferritin-like domain-containing protein [Thermincola sp.]|jgi:bacterioferritin|nr:ferritin-like domain-containing protein [Thermincola sp.]MDT3703309.1 ferritin-like domain-containing protein [Thermincola sp.]